MTKIATIPIKKQDIENFKLISERETTEFSFALAMNVSSARIDPPFNRMIVRTYDRPILTALSSLAASEASFGISVLSV